MVPGTEGQNDLLGILSNLFPPKEFQPKDSPQQLWSAEKFQLNRLKSKRASEHFRTVRGLNSVAEHHKSIGCNRFFRFKSYTFIVLGIARNQPGYLALGAFNWKLLKAYVAGSSRLENVTKDERQFVRDKPSVRSD